MSPKEVLSALIAEQTGLAVTEVLSLLSTPPDPKMGDYAFPCFQLSKTQKKAPNEIATELSARLSDNIIERAEPAGAYVNISLSIKVLAEHLPNARDLHVPAGHETICVESPSPNTNKPLHLGHVRNMLLGSAVVSLLKRRGHKALRLDLVNDRGVHICKSILAYERWGNNATPESMNMKGDHFCGHFYVIFAGEVAKNPALEEEAQEMLRKWETGDEHVRALWKKMRDWCLEGFAQTYKDFGVHIDHADYESEIYAIGKSLVADALAQGVFEQDETGAVFATVPSGKKYVQRADGTAIYITQDIALAKKRFETYHMNRLVYVVGSEQMHHFQSLFSIFKQLTWPFADKCYHLSYGMIYLPEGKMKSREGTVVDADNLRAELISMAKEEISTRFPDLEVDELNKRANGVAMAALRFHILKYDPVKDFTYDPKESISFTGDTGPYVQYTYARISSIFRKANVTSGKLHTNALTELFERQLLTTLARYPDVLAHAADSYRPSEICAYTLEVAQLANSYYHDTQILVPDERTRETRLWLLDRVRDTLRDALHVIDIPVLEEM